MKGKRCKIVSFKLSEEELRQLDSYAQSHGLNRSEVIREALSKMINNKNGSHELEKRSSEKDMIIFRNDQMTDNVIRRNKVEIILKE